MEGLLDMNLLSNKINKAKSMLQFIDEAFQCCMITTEKVSELYLEIEKLTRTLVKYLNHGSSTSLSLKNYERITKSIDYLFIHGFEELQYDYNELSRRTISAIYHIGLNKVNDDVTDMLVLLDEIRKIQLPFPNNRYLSIINEQYPNYLKLFNSYEAIFNYHEIEEDLDYPLIDGLPLYHDMYHLQGTDLAFEYLKRFYIEARFCNYFKKDIKELLRCYEAIQGVEVEFLGMNLYELILNQVVGSYLLNQKRKLIFDRADIDEIKSKLLRVENIEDEVYLMLLELAKLFDEALAEYIWKYRNHTYFSFKQFAFNEFQLLTYYPMAMNQNMILLDPPQSNQVFLRTLDYMQGLCDVKMKIKYLQSISISIYDVIDLLENEIFIEHEYALYYVTFSPTEIAVILKILNPTLTVFHHRETLNDAFYREIDASQEWVYYFIQFLKSCSNEEKGEIECVLNQLQIK